ncbi:sulfurtransferase complex subunit TusB [Mangrovitalea sediminis]|uniref:sulfurtransferase complex subunit TusB n=1 Tax=Mangrovitalea sediminis TaxID=1982043 RepID=UPI000BE4D412|nr:sulfurtransferase complex subunit TusB [Mangrovitalea sediminis]
MSTLHLLNKTPDRERARQCLAAASASEAGPHGILLLENGVFCAVNPDWRQALEDGLPLWALTPDVAARSLTARLPSGIQQIDYDAFVELTTRFDNVVSW